jgi:3-dehydroquinate synthase/3-dehydroquinate dehydratase type II
MPRVEELILNLSGGAIPIWFADASMEWAGEQIAEMLPKRPRLFVISDETVALLYEKPLADALQSHGFDTVRATFEPGEMHKNLRTVSRLLDTMAEHKLARDDVVIGVGGGVSTDIAGFAASIYVRGLCWIAVPTSLVGMADAAIGGKTGVDHPLGKNLIGTFYQPMAVFAPLKILETLPPREWISGSAEVVKAALLSGGHLWDTVLELGPDLYSWPRARVFDVITDAARVKMEIVAKDDKEGDLRRLLNLGHTFGHALEAATKYEVFLHGEAIFVGLRAAVALSHAQGLLSVSDSTRIDDLLASVALPQALIEPDALIEALGHDKKTRDGRLHWVLIQKPGQAVITSEVSLDAVRKVAEWICEIASSGRQIMTKRTPRILVLNGPNLNLVGAREPELYGHTSHDELEAMLHNFAEEQGVELLIRQSNLEGDLVSLIQQARHWADGIIINSGGYTHTSVAIRDALSAVTLPAIEVHLTDITARDEFRRVSLISPVCRTTISGRGIQGYFEAVRELKSLIEMSAPKSASGAPAIS